MELTLLTQEGCNPCERVKRILAGLRAEGTPINVREVPFDSPEGLDLALANSVLYPPAVFLDGRLLAKGRIHEEELRGALSGRREERLA